MSATSYICLFKQTKTYMNEILKQFAPITLEEMSSVKLMNRTDTKFVTTMPMLLQLL